MAKLTLDSVVSGFKSVSRLIFNFQSIEDELNDKVLYRVNPTGEPNQMENILDMNSNQVNNISDGTSNSDGVNLGQVNNLISAAGGDGNIVRKRILHIATTAQTLFSTTPYTYIVGSTNIDVRVNGLPQTSGVAYTETGSTSITFTSPLNVSDEVTMYINVDTTNTTITNDNVDTIQIASDWYGYVSTDETLVVKMLGHNTKGDGGEGDFIYTTGVDKSTANGITVWDTGETIADQGNGSGGGVWVRQYSGAVNIKWGGASSSLSASINTPLIQAVLDGDYLEVVIDDDFEVNATITTSIANRTINGTGGSIYTTGTAIATVDNLILITGDKTKIHNLTVHAEASVSTCSGIFIQANKVSLIENDISNFTNGAGIAANNAYTEQFIKNNRIFLCSPYSYGGNQYGSIHCNSDYSTISGNLITGNELTGISLFGADFTTISGNTINCNNGGSMAGGVILDGKTVSCVIEGNTIRNSDVEGIQIAGSTAVYGGASADSIIANNSLIDCVYSAITLYGAQVNSVVNITISGNHISNSGSTNRAIELNNVNNIHTVGNFIKGYSEGLGVIASSPDCSVVDNVFKTQTGTAIQANGSRMLVSGNRVTGNGVTTVGISFNAVTIAGEQFIEGNQVMDCATGILGTFNTSFKSYVYNNHFLDNTVDDNFTNPDPDSVKNNVYDRVISGVATLVAGTVTVTVSSVRAGENINFYTKTPLGTEGALFLKSVTAGAGFLIYSTSSTDISEVYWEFIR